MEALHETHHVTVLSPKSQQTPDYTDWPEVDHITFKTSPAPLRLLRAVLALSRGFPAQCGMYHYPDLGKNLRLLAPNHDVSVLLLARLALHAPDLGQSPWIADLVDALSLSFSRRSHHDRALYRPLLKLETALLAKAEATLMDAATRTLLVCDRDAEYLEQSNPRSGSTPLVVPVAAAEPTAPLQSILPGPSSQPTIDVRPTLAFTGNLGYFVNHDGLSWWLDSVWPLLHERRPELQLLVAGDRPPPSLARRVTSSGGQLVARPRDLRGLLGTSTLAIAPLRCGAGMPLKVIDAWSVGVPVVASSWAAAGVDGKDGQDLRVADTVEDWLAVVEELLDQPEQRTRLAAGGRDSLKHRFGRETVFASLRRVVAETATGGCR